MFDIRSFVIDSSFVIQNSSLFEWVLTGMSTEVRIVRLCELEPERLDDCFAILSAKERATTREGKPYFRTTFRDAGRSVTCMVWSDTVWFADCEEKWKVGGFYKLRCRYSESSYGPQIELDRVREVAESDRASVW